MTEPQECVECEELGCPTEGMTLVCQECGKVVCAGHVTRHEETKHAPKPDPDPDDPLPTRQELIKLCEDGIRPMSKWYDRDSLSAQLQLGKAWVLLRAGVEFTFDMDTKHPGTYWIDFHNIEGFNYHEYGEEGLESEHAYIPTRKRLEDNADGDWY